MVIAVVRHGRRSAAATTGPTPGASMTRCSSRAPETRPWKRRPTGRSGPQGPRPVTSSSQLGAVEATASTPGSWRSVAPASPSKVGAVWRRAPPRRRPGTGLGGGLFSIRTRCWGVWGSGRTTPGVLLRATGPVVTEPPQRRRGHRAGRGDEPVERQIGCQRQGRRRYRGRAPHGGLVGTGQDHGVHADREPDAHGHGALPTRTSLLVATVFGGEAPGPLCRRLGVRGLVPPGSPVSADRRTLARATRNGEDGSSVLHGRRGAFGAKLVDLGSKACHLVVGCGGGADLGGGAVRHRRA